MKKYLLFVSFLVLSMVLIFLIQERRSFKIDENGVYKKGQVGISKNSTLEKRVPIEEKFSEELLKNIEKGALEDLDYKIDQGKGD